MSKTWRDIILQGVLVTLISSVIIGGILFYIDYHIYKAKQEVVNKKIDKNEIDINKQYRVIIQNIKDYEKKVDEHNQTLNSKIESVNTKINTLTYVITNNNKEIGKKLKQLRDNGLYASPIENGKQINNEKYEPESYYSIARN